MARFAPPPLPQLPTPPASQQEATLRVRLTLECPPKLIAHMDRVVAIADQLATRWQLDVPLARLMAQAHDVVRHLEDPEWLQRAHAYSIPTDPIEQLAPVLLHGPIGAHELRARLDITDERILHAVHWHTPGHPDYPPEAWAMFIADKVEPNKARKWPPLLKVHRDATERSLQAAALRYLNLRIKEAVREDYLLHPHMLTTRNALLEQLA